MATLDRKALPLFAELQGARVLVRPYRESDAADLFAAVEESREQLTEWIGFAEGHQSLEQSLEWIRRQQTNWQLHDDFPVAVRDKATDRYLGDCRLRPWDWETGFFTFSYWLRTSATGHGYMTEAVELLADFAFNRLLATRLEIRCDERNTASAAIAKRAGFRLEARLEGDGFNHHGFLRTTLVFSRTADQKPQN